MARIFTTQFNYNHQDFDAIVTVIPKDGSILFNVKVIDMDLHEVLPGGELSFQGVNGLKEDIRYDNKLSLALMQSISAAIQEHLANIQ